MGSMFGCLVDSDRSTAPSAIQRVCHFRQRTRLCVLVPNIVLPGTRHATTIGRNSLQQQGPQLAKDRLLTLWEDSPRDRLTSGVIDPGLSVKLLSCSRSERRPLTIDAQPVEEARHSVGAFLPKSQRQTGKVVGVFDSRCCSLRVDPIGSDPSRLPGHWISVRYRLRLLRRAGHSIWQACRIGRTIANRQHSLSGTCVNCKHRSRELFSAVGLPLRTERTSGLPKPPIITPCRSRHEHSATREAEKNYYRQGRRQTFKALGRTRNISNT